MNNGLAQFYNAQMSKYKSKNSSKTNIFFLWNIEN